MNYDSWKSTEPSHWYDAEPVDEGEREADALAESDCDCGNQLKDREPPMPDGRPVCDVCFEKRRGNA